MLLQPRALAIQKCIVDELSLLSGRLSTSSSSDAKLDESMEAPALLWFKRSGTVAVGPAVRTGCYLGSSQNTGAEMLSSSHHVVH